MPVVFVVEAGSLHPNRCWYIWHAGATDVVENRMMERLMKLHTPQTAAGHPILVNGHPILTDRQPVLGTYVAQDVAALKQVRDIGMNVVIGDLADLDPESETGKFCLDSGIKILYHMTKHVYGKPRLGDTIDAEKTTLPLAYIGQDLDALSDGGTIPESGVILLDNELVRYEARTKTELLDCRRGYESTVSAEHRYGTILFFPDECAADVEQVKDSPNLWGYYAPRRQSRRRAICPSWHLPYHQACRWRLASCLRRLW